MYRQRNMLYTNHKTQDAPWASLEEKTVEEGV